ILSSVNLRAGDVFRVLLEDKDYRASGHGRELLGQLATLIGNANRENELAALVQGLATLPESEKALLRDLVRNLSAKLPAPGGTHFARDGGGQAEAMLDDLLRDALTTAPDEKRSVADRVAAIRTLGLAPFADVKDLARRLLNFRQPQPVQAAAMETLARIDE